MTNADAGGGDRVALAVLTQYRMGTTQQLHRVLAPGVRIEQTRRRLAKLRAEGLVDRVTLPQAGRLRAWFPTAYGVRVAMEWPELRERRAPRLVSDPVAARLRTGHALAVTETALVFLEDARRRGETCLPLDWLPEVHHPIGNDEAVIPDALMYYRSSDAMLRAFVEVDRATMGPERLAAKLTAYARLHRYIPGPTPGRRWHTTVQGTEEAWRQRYPLFPRLLFVLDGTGPTGQQPHHRSVRPQERPGGEQPPAPLPSARRPAHRSTRPGAGRTHMATDPGSRPARRLDALTPPVGSCFSAPNVCCQVRVSRIFFNSNRHIILPVTTYDFPDFSGGVRLS
ncbi:replication-relaxation family protein [Streptomyces niveus]|uniref:replication-relaxation family protein n=1 Tax=Streptomyces niveus TaxID=193462 RepID=UPI0036A41529